MPRPRPILPGLALPAITACALAACASAHPGGRPTPRLVIAPEIAQVDEPIRIRAEGLEPGSVAQVVMRWPDAPGGPLRSFTQVHADRRGRIDLGTQAPDTGSYAGVDANGLLWSLGPDGSTAMLRGIPWRAPMEMRLLAELRVGGRSVDARMVTRRLMAPGVRVRDVSESGIVARLYAPAAARRRLPVVIVLGGSEGGFDDLGAAVLASHGYAALAVAYFGVAGLPEELFEIPVERVANAVAWVRTQPELDVGRIAVMGGSKGAELALVAATRVPEIRAVVAYAPTDVVNQGIDRRGQSRPQSSWTWGGVPLPFLVLTPPPAFQAQFRGPPPFRLRPLYEASRSDSGLARAAIPVERIRGAVLLISGADDQMIPSAPAAEAVVRRLRDAHHPYPYLHRSYPDAGHVILLPYLPTPARDRIGPWLTGGTPAGYARADAESWPLVLRFLADALR